MKNAASAEAGGVEGGKRAYLATRYVRSPASFLVDSTVRPIFLVRFPLMKPRIEWFCQSVALAISAIVAPLGRRRRSRMMFFFENSRGTLASFTLATFLLATFSLACFFGAALACLAAFFAPLLALGAPFFWLAAFFEVAFSGAPCAPCSATAAVSVVLVASAFFMVVFILLAVDPRMTIHHSGGPGRQGLISGIKTCQ